MRLGIFAKIFVRPTLAETLDAVVAHGLDCVQFNFACAGLPSLPEKISPALAAEIGRAMSLRQLNMAAVSGTFNMIDPDRARRQEGLRRLSEIAASCAAIGSPLVTLCTGTRDAQDMWRHHPENESPEAWREMLESMARAVEIADKYNVFLGIEPETANVVSSAKKARRLLDEMKSPRLKIVMDASNLFHPGDARKKEDILSEAFDLLGPDMVLAHAKDFRDTGKMEYLAPGKGELPWGHYMQLLRRTGFDGPVVMHSLPEADVDESVTFLKEKMKETGSSKFLLDGIRFHFQEKGWGKPFFYQHGLGGSVAQPFGLFEPPAGFRLMAFDCRGHGQTHPIGPLDKINFNTFADDLLALMDHLQINRAIVGGISMGAGLALNFALRHGDRVRGLVLQRPAWLDGPRKDNMDVYSTMARLIREQGPEKGLKLFKASAPYQKVLREAPSAAQSLAGQFLDPRAAEIAPILERIPVDAPNHDRAEWRTIKVPTLVLANRIDPVHPYEFGEALAAEIPNAAFRELTPKFINLEQHGAEVQRFIGEFLLRHF